MDENAAGGVITAVATENATSVSVDDDRFEIADGNLKLTDATSLDFESDSSPIEVTITASGDGASATHTVSVSINDVDEAPSAPMVRDAELSVDENDAGATLSSLADSTDPEGEAVTYSVDNDKFEITSGLILKLKDGMYLDYEEDGASVDLVITASDPAGNSSMTTVTVTVGNVNEAPEVMADDHAVDENMAGVGLGAITPSDPDGDTLTVEVSGDDRFEARQDDQGGWWVALKDGESLDYETEQSVDLMVTVTDADGLSATTDVTVTVNDVNEAPEIMVGDASVAENDAGADVATVSATDVDMGDTHTFEVSDNRFEVAGGMLKLKDGESLNHEDGAEVMVMVTVTDDGDPAMSASADVTIAVTDANDDPMFARDAYAFNLSENEDGSTTAVSLGMVSATDPDDDTLEYSISGGNDDGLFAIDSATGEISYVGTGEDYRSSVSGPSHTLTIEVSDGTSSDEASVAITILNANDAPEFGASSYTFDLAENEDGSTTAIDLGMVSATDSDEGDAVEYSITAGNDDGLFAIDSASGAITYVGSGEDAESGAASHELTVTASDGSAMSEVMVTINVTNANDSAPMFGEDSYAFDLAENADGSATAVEVGMVSATDSDGDTLEYSISSGNDDGMFAIDSASGAITYVGMGENYESDTMSHELMVEASDGANSDSATVTVSVTDANDAPMADAEMMIGTFALVNGAEGSMNINLGALFSDEDGDTLTYTLDTDQDSWLSLAVTTDSDGSVTGRVHGTPPDDGNNIEAMVTIVATDADGATGEATFYVVVDAENAAPSSVKLRQTDDGVTSVVTAVTVPENAMGASFGMVSVEDVDNAMHPHGQHMFTFEVDGEADERFEVVDGRLKLKDDQVLDYEEFEDGTFTLKVTAKDMYVTAPGEDEEDTRGSASMTLDVTVTNTSDAPVAGKIGDWWVTVDDRLDAEEAREGEWLSFGLKTTGEDAAFTDEDSSKLYYSIVVHDADGDAVDWLQIDEESGAMTNREGKDGDELPEAGVYTVTVTAKDGKGEDANSASASFKLAVAVGDLDNSDNDRPDIRDVNDYDYTEGSGGGRVASFEVRDDDLPIAPHPYGTLEVDFTAMQGTANVKNRFKLVEVEGDPDNDPTTTQYEIHHKSAAELAVDDEGEPLVDAMGKPNPIKPIDYEGGDEVVFAITATDGQGEMDNQRVTVDIEDVDDAAPKFSEASIASPIDATRKVDPMTKAGTTTLEVDQQDGATVVVVQLSEVWSDPDTDVDELDFSVGGKSGLPDWIKVYGPDEWEDIYSRRDDVQRGDGPSGLRDRDPAIAIVIDHSASMGDERSPGEALGSFTVKATDPDGNSTTETISIDVKDINVDIPTASEDDVVMITGDPDGTGSLEMVFDQDLDPDFAAGESPVLVLYTWSHDNATPTDTTDDVIISVSTSPQPLPLLVDANGDGIPDVDGSGNVNRAYTTAGDATLTHTITAKVEYYEVNPDGTIRVVSHDAEAEVAADTTATPRAVPAASTASDDVSFHITTAATGLSVFVGATGQPAAAAGTVRLEVSTNGTSGWITEVGETAADATSGVTAAITLAVDEDSDGTSGDGGGLYYRVVYTYNDENGRPVEVESEVVDQLGNVTVSTGNGDPTAGNATLGNATAVDGTIRADTEGNPADVQWQMWVDANRNGTVQDNEWVDIAGETGVSLTITNEYVGSQLRAKVTYKHEDNSATEADESTWIRWVETTAPLAGPADPANVLPTRTQATEEIRVNITQTMDAMGAKTSVDGTGSGTVADEDEPLFFDSDGDTLTYNLASTAGLTFQAGNTVYVSGDLDATATGDQTQTLAIDADTGAITYYTNSVTTHDADPSDGAGNTLVFDVNADDGTGDSATDVTVTVRINVSPTAINNVDGSAALAATDAAAAALNTPFSIDETAGVTSAQATAIGAFVSLDVQDQNSVTDDFGTHDVTVMSKGANGKFAPDGRFEVTHNGGGRVDSDDNGSTWEVRVKEGAKFDYESKANPMGVVTIKVTATDKGGHSVDAYFTIAINDVTDAADTKTGNDNSGDPHYKAPTTPTTPPPAEDPETPGLEDDSDDSDDDGAIPPPPEPPAGTGMFIEDDLLGDYVLAIDDIDIA